MARVKIEMPGNDPVFKTSISVRISDLNYGNHLGNDSVLTLIHEARVQMLNAFGCTELDVGGCGIIMADAAIVYRNEGHYGYVIDIAIHAVDIGTVGFDLYYQLSTEQGGKKMEIARAKTGIVCYDYRVKKISPIPPGLLAQLQA